MGRKEKTIFITIIANIILIVLRFFLANLSGSIGLTANAWHSFTDVFVSTVVFIGLMITHAGAEKLGKTVEKIEHVLAIFVAIFIFYMGIEILEEALSSNAAELRYVPFTAAGAFLGEFLHKSHIRVTLIVGAIGKLTIHIVDLSLHLCHFGESLASFFAHCSVILKNHHLWQIADSLVVWHGYIATCRLLLAAKYL